MSFKQRLDRFRKWQQEPFSYSRDTSTHKCNNCGEQFQGNYCPTCSQGAHMGRITWESVGRGFLELWGLHTRSCGVLFPIPVVLAIFIVVGISRACIKY